MGWLTLSALPNFLAAPCGIIICAFLLILFLIFTRTFIIESGAILVIIFTISKFWGENFQYMEKIILQISKIAACEGVSIGSMEKKIGASKGVLARAIANGTDIQAKWVQLIAENYPRYSAEWLLTGEGAMLKADNEPQPVSEPPTAEPEVVAVLRQQLAEKDKQIAALISAIGSLKPA